MSAPGLSQICKQTVCLQPPIRCHLRFRGLRRHLELPHLRHRVSAPPWFPQPTRLGPRPPCNVSVSVSAPPPLPAQPQQPHPQPCNGSLVRVHGIAVAAGVALPAIPLPIPEVDAVPAHACRCEWVSVWVGGSVVRCARSDGFACWRAARVCGRGVSVRGLVSRHKHDCGQASHMHLLRAPRAPICRP